MANSIYVLESYNAKKKLWEHRTSSNSLANAKKHAIEVSKYEKNRWKITKETLLGIYEEGKLKK